MHLRNAAFTGLGFTTTPPRYAHTTHYATLPRHTHTTTTHTHTTRLPLPTTHYRYPTAYLYRTRASSCAVLLVRGGAKTPHTHAYTAQLPPFSCRNGSMCHLLDVGQVLLHCRNAFACNADPLIYSVALRCCRIHFCCARAPPCAFLLHTYLSRCSAYRGWCGVAVYSDQTCLPIHASCLSCDSLFCFP